MTTIRSPIAPLIGQLSNRDLLITIEELLTCDNAAASVFGAKLCRCGCGQFVVAGRKFVNQEHYDRGRTLQRGVLENS